VLRGERDLIQATTRTLMGRPTTFVGRDRELLTLEAVFAECQSELVAQAVLVTGPAGVGKSRLRYEFLRRLRERHEPVEVWIARGEPLTAGSPLGLLGQAIRRATGVLDGEPAAAQQGRLRGRIARHLDEDEAARIAEFVGELTGVEFPADDSPVLRTARDEPRVMAEHMRRAWEDWLAAECAAQPVVIVLEDLHWGDLPTVQFLDRALRNLSDRSLMVLALARPDIDAVFPGIWSDRAVTRMQLRDLSRRAAAKLVRESLGAEMADFVVDRIVTQAAGNAFYLEELIRAAADTSIDTLPTTVLAMLQTRLEELPVDARRVLRAGSVFGTTFWRGAVVALLGGDRRSAQLDDWLAFLEQREVLTRRPDSKFPGEVEYVFRHGLVSEAAYRMLTEADGRLGHRLAGKWLERSGESDPRVLAEHFERGGEATRAAKWHLRAGEKLLAEGLPESALESLARANELGVPERALPKLATAIGRANRYLGRYEETLTWVEAMLTRECSPEIRAVFLETRIAALRHLDTWSVLRLADETLDACAAVGNLDAYAHVLSQAAFAAYRQGDADACARFERLAREQQAGGPRAAFHLLRTQMFAAEACGSRDDAIELSTRIREQALALGDVAAAANESNNLAEGLLETGLPERARDEARRALELARSVGFRNVELYARILVSAAEAELGAVQGMLELFGEAEEMRTLVFVDGAHLCAFHLLERGQPGDAEAARKVAGDGLRKAIDAGVEHRLAGLLATLARAAHRLGRGGEALSALEKARGSAARASVDGRYHLALAEAELLDSGELRRTVLAAIRTELLAAAEKRRDPRAYLVGVRLHRRLLELSGGLPDL
jgi:eukaryotic-like serine/threonine-protein kinase